MIAAARLLDSYYCVQVLITGDGLTSLEIGLNPCSIKSKRSARAYPPLLHLGGTGKHFKSLIAVFDISPTVRTVSLMGKSIHFTWS